MKTLTVKETAQRLGCSLKWVFDLLYAAKLPGATKARGQWRIPAVAVEQRLKQREARNG
jgi:excisionase family DNA binding protein